MSQQPFSANLLQWFDIHGRKDLPWQKPRNPYRVWISEIMLQQTQVKTVIPYFNNFMEKFPDIQQLAEAEEDQVLAQWSGLGYYSRARYLHKTAQIICEKYQGEFPSDLTELISLPGIGRSTAGAIASQAFNQATAILDGNVKRVLCRYFLVEGWPELHSVKQKLWHLAEQCMPSVRCADYTQAIMDLGATCCKPKNPDCANCPLQKNCLAKQKNLIGLYPHKKAKKTLPRRQQQFLLVHDAENKIYLEKNPPTGLWAGLWCMPSTELEHCPLEYLTNHYSFNCINKQELLFIRHSFSHFNLEIKALAVKASVSPNLIAEGAGRWFNADELQKLGLAKPVNEIIRFFLAKVFSPLQRRELE